VRTVRRVGLVLVIGIGVLFAAAVAVRLLLSRGTTLERIREVIRNRTQQLGVDLDVGGVDIGLTPAPHVVLQAVTLSAAGRASGRVDSVHVYPRLLPLLRGHVELATVALNKPSFDVSWQPAPAPAGPTETLTLSEERDRVVVTVSDLGTRLSRTLPGLRVDVSNGALRLAKGDAPPLQFDAIHGQIRLPPDLLGLDLTCTSSLAKRLAVQLTLQPSTFVGSGRIQTDALHPHTAAILSASIPSLLGASVANVDVTTRFEGPRSTGVSLRGTASPLTLRRGSQEIPLQITALEATLNLRDDAVDFSLANLQVTPPGGSLSGTLGFDSRVPRVAFTLNAKDIEIADVRSFVTTLALDSDVAQDIFNVLRAGHVPQITIQSQGARFSDLGNTDNLVIRGTVTDGELFVSGPALQLSRVNGEALVEKGVLLGERASARTGNSTGDHGSIKLQLAGDTELLFLDVTVAADVADVPPVLARLVNDPTFQEQLRLFSDVNGNAHGRLTLQDASGDLDTRVEVTGFDVSGRYEPMQAAFHLRGDRFEYAPTTLAFAGVTGTVGAASSIDGVALRFRWKEEPAFEVLSGQATLSLDELHGWLKALPSPPPIVRDLRRANGRAIIDSLTADGLFSAPHEWRFDVTATIADANLETPWIPGITTVFGQVAATNDALTVTQAGVKFLDSDLTGSLNASAYLGRRPAVTVKAEGSMGPRSSTHILRPLDIYPRLRIDRSVTIANGQFAWTPEAATTVAGTFTLRDGPVVALDVRVAHDTVDIRRLDIDDRHSRAHMRIGLLPNQLEVAFDGNLRRATVDNVFADLDEVPDEVGGSFSANLDLERPLNSRAQGHIEVHDAEVPLAGDEPIQIEAVALTAAERTVHVDSADIHWGPNRVAVEGAVESNEQGLLLDLDVSAPTFDATQLGHALRSEARKDQAKEHNSVGPDLERVSLAGAIRFQSNEVSLDKFDWNEVQGTIGLQPESVDVTLSVANLCGIHAAGTLRFFRERFEAQLSPSCHEEDLSSTLSCLLGEEAIVTGTYTFSGEITGTGTYGEFLSSLHGPLALSARDGRIYRWGVLAKILNFLNVTEGFVGNIPDLGRSGLPYSSFTLKGSLQDGRFLLHDSVLYASALTLVASGMIDPRAGKLDITVLASPLGVLRPLLSRIPIVRRFDQSAISVPIRVSGNIRDPSIIPLDPSAVGEHIFSVLKSTVQLPVTLIRPMLPGGHERGNAPVLQAPSP